MTGPWQKSLIWLARNRALTRCLHGSTRLARISRQFVGGPDARAAVETAQRLRRDGVRASMFYLGEYVTERDEVARTVEQKEAVIAALQESGLDVHVSVDPTQIGYSIADNLGRENALRIGRRLRDGARTPQSFLMLDMEDSSITERTIALRCTLQEQGIPTAITQQAYLKRTEADLRELIAQRCMSIRLVKGAFAESGRHAWTRREDIDASYLRLAAQLLPAGPYPVFASHDERIVRAVMRMARERGIKPGQYEFEMLYGVRPRLQQQLVAEGEQLRVYVPFGTEWWPYTARRIGENPANAMLLTRALAGRG